MSIDLEALRRRYSVQEERPTCEGHGRPMSCERVGETYYEFACDHPERCWEVTAKEDPDVLALIDEVTALRAQLAEAMQLRLKRPLTLTDLDAHGGDTGVWLVPINKTAWAKVSGAVLRHCLRGAPVEGAIPLDANGQPCPIGGWSREAP